MKKNVLYKIIFIIMITIGNYFHYGCSSIESYKGDGMKAEIWLEKYEDNNGKNDYNIVILHFKLVNQTNKNVFIEYANIGNPQIVRQNFLLTQDLSYDIPYAVLNQEVSEDIWKKYNCFSLRDIKGIDDSNYIPNDLLSKIKIKKGEILTIDSLTNSNENYSLTFDNIISEIELYFQDKIMLNRSGVFETCFLLRLSSFPKGGYKIFIKYPNKISSRSSALIKDIELYPKL